MPKLRSDAIEARIYSRQPGNAPPRYYGDFRDYTKVGGSQEALIPDGSRNATRDYSEALALASRRLAELQRQVAAGADTRPAPPRALATFDGLVPRHLQLKRARRPDGTQWLGNVQIHLETAAAFFGRDRDLGTIEVHEVTDYEVYLLSLPNGRGGTLSTTSVVQYLNSLSNLFRRAQEQGLVPPGFNPVRGRMDVVTAETAKTPYLEINETAEILRYAFEEYRPDRPDRAIPFFAVILATLALTGMREREVLGLLVDDIDLEHNLIYLRPNHYRRLKSAASERVIPIFSQLREFLLAYLAGPHAPADDLLFPAPRSGGRRMIRDLRKACDRMPMPARLRRLRTAEEMTKEAERRAKEIAKWERGGRGARPRETLDELRAPIDRYVIPPLRTKMLRHTYCAARIQTTDGGKPIALYTVATEFGHADTKMIHRVYGHLQKRRSRGEEVAYWW